MSDRTTQSLSVNEDTPPIDWHAAAPSLELRWFAAAGLLVPLLLAAGVYWLHHVPAGPGPRATDSVVEVRLITVAEPVEQRQEASLQPSVATARQSEALVEDPDRSIPEDTIAPLPSEPGRASPPAATFTPASPAAPVRMLTSQTAAIFQRALLTHIARYRHYPDQARRDRVQGTVQLVFAMRRDGMVTDVWVKASSGHNALDLAAVDTIRKAQPLPKIPSEMPDQLNISMPVAFDLP